MKRLFPVALIFLLFISCAPAAEPETENTPVSTSTPLFSVGYLSNSDRGGLVQSIRQVSEAAGGELLVEVCDLSPMSMITSVNKLIDAGCDGIVLMPTSESILTNVSEICEEAQVFWTISMRPVLDETIKKILAESTYFVGSVMENDEEVAYELMKLLAEHEKKNVVLVSTVKTDPVEVVRERGINRAAEEFGMNIVAEIHNTISSEDTYNAIYDVLRARPEVDAVFRVSGHGSNMEAIIQAISDSGKADLINLVHIDMAWGCESPFEKNILLAMAGGHQSFDSLVSAAILVNALLDPAAAQKAPKQSYIIDYLIFRSSEDVSLYWKFYEDRDGTLLSDDAVKRNLLNRDDRPMRPADYERFIAAYTMEHMRQIIEGVDIDSPFE